MPLETGSFISDLVSTNPVATDGINAGDDHIRLIKSLLLSTFSAVTGEVTASHTDLSNGYVPIGGIIMWSGSLATIPTNWVICDGTNSTPDLRDKFVVGAGSTYAPGAGGGSLTTDEHTLTVAEVPTSPNATPTADGDSVTITQSLTEPTVEGHTHTYIPPYYALAYIMRSA